MIYTYTSIECFEELPPSFQIKTLCGVPACCRYISFFNWSAVCLRWSVYRPADRRHPSERCVLYTTPQPRRWHSAFISNPRISTIFRWYVVCVIQIARVSFCAGRKFLVFVFRPDGKDLILKSEKADPAATGTSNYERHSMPHER